MTCLSGEVLNSSKYKMVAEEKLYLSTGLSWESFVKVDMRQVAARDLLKTVEGG